MKSPEGVLVLGKRYLVPAVRVREWHGERNRWLPVMGPKHTDREIVGFPDPHFHIDWRFVSLGMFRAYGDIPRAGFHLGRPLQCPDNRGDRVILEGPTLRSMTYKRAQTEFPRRPARWLPRLEEAFACTGLRNGLCPHRGIPASAMHREGDVLTCPGHGLRFDANTGQLLPGPNVWG